jgi:hypothetical protein
MVGWTLCHELCGHSPFVLLVELLGHWLPKSVAIFLNGGKHRAVVNVLNILGHKLVVNPLILCGIYRPLND